MAAATFANKITGACTVITGAGSGLGKGLARLGGRYGMRMVLVDHDAKSLDEIYGELESVVGKKNLLPVVADVSKFNDIENVGIKTRKEFGVPNLVFNNAGIVRAGLSWEHSLEEWKWILGVNVMGVVHGIKVFTPMMLDEARSNASYRGRIINTGSMAGLVSMPTYAIYSVSKHAVVTLSETLYHDLKIVSDQVSASVLCPFYVPTNLAHSPTPSGLHEEARPSSRIGQEFTAAATKAGRLTADDVAQIVFTGIEKGNFYIYTHHETLAAFKVRSDDMLNATNPSDPFILRPEVGKIFRETLKKAYQK
jgi:short-subunit dehydrogenase